MGRPYAKLFRDIWSDADFSALPPGERYLYMFLFSQPNLNAAGILPLTIKRWADIAGDLEPSDIEAGIAILEERRYVVTDAATEELLIRTFIRNDDLWRIPNTLYAVLRDAERTASPSLRQALAAELALLPVDELNGKRSEVMKEQVTRVTATLGSTLRPTLGSTVGATGRQGLRQLFGQPKAQPVGVGVGGGGGTGGSSNSDVVNQSTDRNARDDLTDLIQREIRKATGRDITAEQAGSIRRDLLDGRVVSDPAAYLRSAIRSERNPRERFLPAAADHPSARTPAEAAFVAGIVPNGRPADDETVAAVAAQVRQAITRGNA